MSFIEMRRRRLGLTQTELAKILCVDQTAISKWENGASLPTADKLRPLAKALGCTIDELLGADEASA